MRAVGALLAASALLCLLASQAVAEDIYWEGQEDNSNEFLEVNVRDFGIAGHLKRIKRGWFDLFDTKPSEDPVTEENVTSDPGPPDEEGKDDDENGNGSGSVGREPIPDTSEKTLRVTFIVNQPYSSQYSNRDSEEFQSFSKSLADAVNKLYLDLPGTQTASLVRIQSRLSDSFTCKVTLDIVTTDYYDIENINNILLSHIKEKRSLDYVAVSDEDYSSNVVDRDTLAIDDCELHEFQCGDGQCVDGDSHCNGSPDCQDGSDEQNCNFIDETNEDSVTTPSPDYNPVPTVPNPEITDAPPLFPSYPACSSDEMICDVTRCIALTKTCDRVNDCDDGTDEESCQTCEPGDFRCNNGKCIAGHQKCNHIVDCPLGEDEQNCECRPDEFTCVSDGSCIEGRKQCDGYNHCMDSSDERDCACSPDQWQCDQGSCIKRTKRCDGRVDCPSDRSDERNCLAYGGYFRCRSGKLIPESQRCDRQYNCPLGDYSDEQNCPCGRDDFKCNNGYCIPKYKHCDRTTDCQDGSDERNCTYGIQCMAYEYKCSDGECVPALSWCNGSRECTDGSDETHCPCKKDEFICRDGTCINIALRCDGNIQCQPGGEDEKNCESTPPPTCDADSFKCNPSSSKQCATRCDGEVECDDGEDEQDCNDCLHQCDGKCLPSHLICNDVADCSDGSDESNCAKCDGPNDFRCNNGDCLSSNLQCNGYSDCEDGSDELECQNNIRPEGGCRDNEFQCRNGICINIDFRCDNKTFDCIDNSDEANCPPALPQCNEDEWQCSSGLCIPAEGYCDGRPDCYDNTDELNCPATAYPNLPPLTTKPSWYPGIEVQTSTAPDLPNYPFTTSIRPDPYVPERGDSRYPNENESDRPPSRSDQNPYDQYTERPPSRSGQYPYGSPGQRQNPYDQYTERSPSRSDQNPYGDPRQRPNPNEIYTERPPSPSQNPYDQDTDRPRSRSDQYPYGSPGQRQNPYDQYTERPPSRSDQYPNGPGQYNPSDTNRCQRNQWRCDSGQCIESHRRCDGRVDCVLDVSDEFQCPPGSPLALQLTVQPDAQSIRYGGDVVFQCRDEGPLRAPVRWVREGGKRFKPGTTDHNGRLVMDQVTEADGGVYICQAPLYLGHSNAEVRVQLTVEPRPSSNSRSAYVACKPNESTCGNGQCIPNRAVCDGRKDCADGSDEDACYQNGICEPNQYQCRNHKCVLKVWFCDSDDDCGDNSDEENCQADEVTGSCRPGEFACLTNNQCVGKSYQCDGTPQCIDKSDESGCLPVHIKRPPSPSNVRLNPGETLRLECEAVGVPIPMVSWRWNWRHVPAKCTATSVHGLGILTCPDIQPEDSGAYSCEAINRIGHSFATPDSIVFVNQTYKICPPGYFNSEALSESDCIKCFCFGESTQCRSADLYTFTMPTPLGEGGTRLVGVRNSLYGEPEIVSIADQYYYQPLRNGGTVTKLASYGSRPYVGDVHPYLTLPDYYNKNQLNSYGGHIKFAISPHSPRLEPDNRSPDIIIKGKHGTLLYQQRSNARYIEARLTPEHWLKTSAYGSPTPATREDIMMALENVELVLLRADRNNAGLNFTEFTMESAHRLNSEMGLANFVEECTCPPGYEGLSCQKCADGYSRENSGPWLGNCVVERKPCPPGYYGDPNSGYSCSPCPCPLTNRENQFARTCSLGPNGVQCDCAPGYVGDRCEVCDRGYTGNPNIPGDSCRPEVTSSCNPVGTLRRGLLDECSCKDQAEGEYCDRCKPGSFFLSEDFRHGCALCFCSGVIQDCTSSNLRRKTTSLRFNTPDIVDQLSVYTSSPQGSASTRTYNAPVLISSKPVYEYNELALRDVDDSSLIYYWSLPTSFAGDKVTSYGGYLRYTLKNVPVSQPKNNAPDVQLISDNHLTYHYYDTSEPSSDGTLNVTIQFLEKGWLRQDRKEITREHMLMGLADVKTILIKASYSMNSQLASLVSASIDTAEPGGSGPPALHVEQCVCPVQYKGTSCEDCAYGYTRSTKGIYLEHCMPCECNGHSGNCDPETGECIDCQDNTYGESCELCKPGYEKNRYGVCSPSYNNPPISDNECNCDPRGEEGPCENGQCRCKQNVEGRSCDTCRPGTFGLDRSNPLGCIACYCSGVTNECHEGRFYRIQIAAPIIGDRNGGYSVTNLNGDKLLNIDFISVPNTSELIYVFPPYPASEPLYWSLPELPGNRVLSYGGTISITQSFKSKYLQSAEPGYDVILYGDNLAIYWVNPVRIRTDEALSYQVPLREDGWTILNSRIPASRNDFMNVLKNLKRVLVLATLVTDISTTSIADVYMDIAGPDNSLTAQAANGVEMCRCPVGYKGTSCESCDRGYYHDPNEQCRRCSCNGHDCHLDNYNQIICDCRPPYSGPDCSSLDGESSVYNSTQPPPGENPTVSVRITSPTIRIQAVGSSVNFTCLAKSLITQNRIPVNWKKRDGYLPQGRSYVDINTGLLIITNLRPSDSGVYICQSNDGRSTAQDIATLQVPGNDISVPEVRIEPDVNDYYEGEEIRLECIVTGNPTPTISWIRGSNKPLPRYHELSQSYLVITSAREEDSGEYRCIAQNAAGANDRTALITVRRRPAGPQRERLTVNPGAATVSEGQTTQLVCTGPPSVPAGSIEWIRQDGAQFADNVRSDNGVLRILLANINNQGIYICQTGSSQVDPVGVLVTVVPLNIPPLSETSNITVDIKTLSIPTGEKGIVNCNPSGNPLPNVKWTKLEGEFGPSTSQRDNSLVIVNARDEDRGYYRCEGIVNGLPLDNQIYVFVDIEKRELPEVEIWPKGEVAVDIGNPTELRCLVRAGIPKPDVTWHRQGDRTLSKKAEITRESDETLRFDSIEVNDEGEYICTATNIAGTARDSTVIKVRSPPVITIMPRNIIEALRGDPVTVDCRASGIPEPQVSIILATTDRQVVVSPQAGSAVLSFPSVSERDEGNYVCLAESPAGSAEEYISIRVNRGDGGEFVYPLEGGSGEVDINTNSIDEPRQKTFLEGENAVLECSAGFGDDLQWVRKDLPLRSNAVQRGSSLHISNISLSDSGLYECLIIDPYTKEVRQAALTRVQVLSIPTITLEPKSQTVHPGQSPTVRCVVNGDDITRVEWRPRTAPFSRRVEVRDSVLIFHNIEVDDAGQYECYAENRHGEQATSTAEVFVRVESDPAESHDNEQFAHAGSAVHLSCNTTQPRLSIRWTKDGRPVPRSVTQKSDGSLFIRLAQKTDSGRYVCHIQDEYGRRTSNYINLHIEGDTCSPDQFQCVDGSRCVNDEFLCDGYADCVDNSDEANCLSKTDSEAQAPYEYPTLMDGPRFDAPALISIDPQREYHVGENVEVLCRPREPGVSVSWERYGDNQQRQFVATRNYGTGLMLYIAGVEKSDEGVYRCTGRSSEGRISEEDYDLQVQSDVLPPEYPSADNMVYTANLGESVGLPCTHDLEPPAQIEWRREFTPLPPEARTRESILSLDRVTEADAGTYICRVSNNRVDVEVRATLRVLGLIPQFNGDGRLQLPTLREPFRQFEIEISFKPLDENGLIFYNSQNPDRTGKYLALQLVEGIPQFVVDFGNDPVIVHGSPLSLNTWHTIRISRVNSKVTMDVDNTGPFTGESSQISPLLELYQPLYIGGVPDLSKLPATLAGTSGFIGCVSMLILGTEDINLMAAKTDEYNVRPCDSCAGQQCLNNGICQEARNERGYNCQCPSGFTGLNCDRAGQACRPGLCGPGKCTNTVESYTCDCPVFYTGRHCEVKQNIEYPAFTGRTYLAIKVSPTSRYFKMTMNVNAAPPVTDGIIMYSAESPRGLGGFMALTVRDGKLEFRYKNVDGDPPVILTANRTLPVNEGTNVDISRIGPAVTLKIKTQRETSTYTQNLVSPREDLIIDTPMFIGGVDDSIILNNNTGVTGGFSGCIKDVYVFGQPIDIINSSLNSANVKECSIGNGHRGDIPENDGLCVASLCRNNGYCSSPDATSCSCPAGWSGRICEHRIPPAPWRRPSSPCAASPCLNGGTCRPGRNRNFNYTCDCPLNYAGTNCQMPLDLTSSVGFNGNGYLELPASTLGRYDYNSEPVLFALAFYTTADGVVLFQRAASNNEGDYIILRVDRGRLVFEWDFGARGSGSSVTVADALISDGKRHVVTLTVYNRDSSVSVIVDNHYSAQGRLDNLLNVGSNIYIGGIPDRYNVWSYSGFVGCIEQLELRESNGPFNLGREAVGGRNPQICKDPRI